MACKTKQVRQLLALAATLLLVIGFAVDAQAFREPDGLRIEHYPRGTKWISGRAGISNAGALRQAPRVFTERHSSRWVVRDEGMNGYFKRYWGEGFHVNSRAMSDAAAALEVAEQFWVEHRELLFDSVSPTSLRPWRNVLSNGIRFVSHRQTLNGVPILGSSNFVAIMSGRLVMFGVRNFPALPFDAKPRLTAAKAAQLAVEALRQRGVTVKSGENQLAAFPIMGRDSVAFKLVYAVELSAPAVGDWTAYIDAKSGELFVLKDKRMFMTAKIHLKHHDEAPVPGMDLIDNLAPHMRITVDGASEYTDENGEFTASGDSAQITAQLKGKYVEVNNQAGSDLQLSAEIDDGETYIWASDGSEFQQSQVDSFRFAAVMREHAKAIGPVVDDVDLLDKAIITNVNYNGSCNAWSSGGSINFLSADNRCNNTAMLGSVVYHEFGHSFHGASIIDGIGYFDGASSEGYSDATSQMIIHSPILGAYFFIGDPDGIRDTEPNMVWPDDQDSDVHITGLILGGALWDLRKALVERHGWVVGRNTTDVIMAGMLKTSGNIPTTYESALLADDDNGDLADGTPNFCIIRREFSLHGLAEDNSMEIELSHQPVEAIETPLTPITIEADVSVGNDDECSEIGNVRVVYSTDNGASWAEIEMDSVGGDAYEAEIPGQEEGTELYYRVEAIKAQSGEKVMRPNNKAEPFYRVYVGPLIEILCEDFESEDPDWTHELLAGDNVDGADDWNWGEPAGEGGDPEAAASGTNVWGNDLKLEESWDGMYMPNVSNTLRSPKWDLTEYKVVRLQFKRWLNVQDGLHDQAKLYVNDEEVWANLATAEEDGTVHHRDREWIHFDLDISELAGEEPEVEIRWELTSDAALEFGGWTIDDVCLYTVEQDQDTDTGDDDDDDDDSADDDDDSADDDDDSADDDDDASDDDDDSTDDDDDSADDDDDASDDDGGSCGCRTPGAAAPAPLRSVTALLSALLG